MANEQLTMPYNRDAEMALLGCILMDAEIAADEPPYVRGGSGFGLQTGLRLFQGGGAGDYARGHHRCAAGVYHVAG